jgi:hypothetical protein
MVSERYRDLLLSTTQIATIHDSSLKLSQALDRIEALCSDPGRASISKADSSTNAPESEGALQMKVGKPSKQSQSGAKMIKALTETDGSVITEQLPAAAAVKLLLDAPEAIYRLLSSRAYLQAAFLWLLARTVKEYMLSPQGDSQDEAYNQVRKTTCRKVDLLIPCIRIDLYAAGTKAMGNAGPAPRSSCTQGDRFHAGSEATAQTRPGTGPHRKSKCFLLVSGKLSRFSQSSPSSKQY